LESAKGVEVRISIGSGRPQTHLTFTVAVYTPKPSPDLGAAVFPAVPLERCVSSHALHHADDGSRERRSPAPLDVTMISGDEPFAATSAERTRQEWRVLDAAALWPVVLLAAVGVMAATCATLGLPIGRATPFILLALLVPFVIFLRRGLQRRAYIWRVCLILLLPAAVSTWVVGWNFSGHVLPDTPSFAPDTWAYNAIGHYLEHHSRTREDGMIVLDEYGSMHRNNRLLSAALLALLQHLSGHIEVTHFVFGALCLSAHFLSMFFFSRSLLGGRGLPMVAAILSTVGGWMCDAFMVGNYDNLLFLAFGPAFLGLALRFLQQSKGSAKAVAPGFRGWILPGAALVAAMFCGYPEGLALLGLTAFPLWAAVVWSCFPAPRSDLKRAWALAGLCGVTLLFVLPEIPMFVGFLGRQLSSSQVSQGARPGEGIFAGLTQARFLPALFALGEEGPGAALRGTSLLLSLLLVYFLSVGALRIASRERWFLWSGALLVVSSSWLGMMLRYDYGLYKAIFCSCWWIYPAMAAGLWQTMQRLSLRSPWWRVGGAAALLGGMNRESGGERDQRALPPGIYTMSALRDVRGIEPLLHGTPLLVDLNNELDELWAVYYLRGLHLLPLGASSYLQSAGPWLAKGRDARLRINDCPYALVSGLRADALWHDARCSLIKNSSAIITQIISPDGVDKAGTEWVRWVGRQTMTMTIVTPAAGAYDLRAKRFWFGPGMPESDKRTVQIVNGSDQKIIVVDPQTRAIPLQLRQGVNQVELRCLNTPTVRVQANGDTRDLLLALVDPFVTSALSP
jgi:hypothetical protein